MNKGRDIPTFDASSFYSSSNETLSKIYYNSVEEENCFFQYEAEDINDDEIACKLFIWRKSYFSFIEKKICKFNYDQTKNIFKISS